MTVSTIEATALELCQQPRTMAELARDSRFLASVNRGASGRPMSTAAKVLRHLESRRLIRGGIYQNPASEDYAKIFGYEITDLGREALKAHQIAAAAKARVAASTSG